MIGLTRSITFLFATLCLAYGCSVPEGGYKEPTPAQNVHYAKYVVVGEVTDLIRPDPLYNYDTSYGAMVNVHCTYKGGPLPAQIQIGGAGFIPGLCTAKDLEKGKTYILFLSEKRQNEDMYEQSQTAELKDKLMDYLRVCDLSMEYAVDNGKVLKRAECPPATKLDTCQRYDGQQINKTTGKSQPVEMQAGGVRGNSVLHNGIARLGTAFVTSSSEYPSACSALISFCQQTEEKRKESVRKSTSDAGNASTIMASSFVTIVFSLIFLYL